MVSSEREWCVYVHISPSGKKYVGITSQKPHNRWRNGNGYKYNIYFTNAIKKYGWDSFSHEIIKSHLTEYQAKLLEINLIKEYQTMNPKYGYNLTAGGDGTTGLSLFGSKNPFYGKKHTPETRQKMRESHMNVSGENNSFYGKKHTEETKKKISQANKGKRCGVNSPHYGKKLSFERVEGIRKAKSIPVCQFDMDYKFIAEYSSIKEAELLSGVDHSLISRVCKGKLKSIHKCRWFYKEDALAKGVI